MRVLRSVLMALIGVLALIITGTVAGVPSTAPWADAPPPLARLIEGLAVVARSAAANPRTALIVTAAIAVPLLLGHLVALIPKSVHTDPVRMFTADQRRAGFNLAGGQCEMEGLLFTRCNGVAAHGDHWFPWSKGGPTTMENFVAACVRCNTSKGAKVPTFGQTQRLAWRRRKYFPAERQHQITPGGKYQARYR